MELIPHKNSDFKFIPYQFKEAYERAMRFRSSDKDYFISDMICKHFCVFLNRLCFHISNLIIS